jgi:hypothetical protein
VYTTISYTHTRHARTYEHIRTHTRIRTHARTHTHRHVDTHIRGTDRVCVSTIDLHANTARTQTRTLAHVYTDTYARTTSQMQRHTHRYCTRTHTRSVARAHVERSRDVSTRVCLTYTHGAQTQTHAYTDAHTRTLAHARTHTHVHTRKHVLASSARARTRSVTSHTCAYTRSQAQPYTT